MTQRTQFGNFAEDLAAQFLEKRGYKILDRNFRRKWGEIDVVAEKADTVVFIEVKASKVAVMGFEPELRAGPQKLAKVLRTAKTYLSYKKLGYDRSWQLDIISIALNKTTSTAKIKHFKNVIGDSA